MSNKYGIVFYVGDRVIDPMDGSIREIYEIDKDETTLFMTDGGCMGIDEINSTLQFVDDFELVARENDNAQ